MVTHHRAGAGRDCSPGIALGLLLAVLRTFGFRLLNALIVVFADVMRALPPLVLIILLFFALPLAGVSLGAFACDLARADPGAGGLRRGDLLGGHPGGAQGAMGGCALHRPRRACRRCSHVVLPQAVRMTVPPLTNRVIATTKGTALGSVVALSEILNQASSSASLAGNATPLTMGARPTWPCSCRW